MKVISTSQNKYQDLLTMLLWLLSWPTNEPLSGSDKEKLVIIFSNMAKRCKANQHVLKVRKTNKK